MAFAIRLFKPRDPKVYLPSWCPSYKSPEELRIYCYKDAETSILRCYMHDKGLNMSPSGCEYALRYQGSSPVSAHDFQRRMKEDYYWNIMPVKVHEYEVIETDDGITPYFFYVKEGNVECIYFNLEKALLNVLEQRESDESME